MKYAKLISMITAFTLMSSAALTGCGSKEEKVVVDTSRNTVEVNLEATSKTASIISITKETTEEEKEEAPAAAEIVSALIGDEVASGKKALYEASVYSQPSNDSSVLGTVAPDTMVTVLGQTANALWYKVSFNGRLCYMKTSEFEAIPVKKEEPKKPVVTQKPSESQKPVKPSESQRPVKPSEKPSETPGESETTKPETPSESETTKPETPSESETTKPDPKPETPSESESTKPDPKPETPSESESTKPDPKPETPSDPAPSAEGGASSQSLED